MKYFLVLDVRRLVLFFLVGICGGIAAVVFQYLSHLGMYVFLDLMAGFRPPLASGEQFHLLRPSGTPFRPWALPLVPALGGILSGLVVYLFAPEAAGHGTDAVINAYHNQNGLIRPRVPFVKIFASVLTIASGGSGGREGPIAQTGAGIGSFLAVEFGLSERDRRVLLSAGMAAGIGAIFKAPLAGALFAAEVLYMDPEFEPEVIIPAGVASVISYCVFCLFFGWQPIFLLPSLAFKSPKELLFYVVLALVVVPLGKLYVKSFYGLHRVFGNMKVSMVVKPAIGGAITGTIGLWIPESLSFGYGYLQQALNGELGLLTLLAMGIGKIFTTSFSIGSGGSGGVFGPSMVIGGAIGCATGKIFDHLFPGSISSPSAFAVVGMAGFFSGVSKAPISTIIMVSEMTGSYHLLLPSLLVSSLSYLLSGESTIFHRQVKNRFFSNAHLGEFFVDILEAKRVVDILHKVSPAETVHPDMTLREFRQIFRDSEQHYFPVIDSKEMFVGIFSINDVRKYLFSEELLDKLTIKDIAQQDIIYVTPNDFLSTVMKNVTRKNIDAIPVVQNSDPRKLIGLLKRKEIISYYNEAVSELRSKVKARQLKQIETKTVSPKDKVFTILDTSYPFLPSTLPAKEATRFLLDRNLDCAPVLGPDGRLLGMVSLADCERFERCLTLNDVSIREVCVSEISCLTPQMDLIEAFHYFSLQSYSVLPVVDASSAKSYMGVVSRDLVMKMVDQYIHGL